MEPALGVSNIPTIWVKQLALLSRRYGWLALLALAPAFLFFQPGLSPALLVVPALLALQTIGVEPGAPRTPLDWPLLLLAVMLLVSLWATFSIAYSAAKIAGLVFGLGLYYALVAGGRERGRALGVMAALHLALGAGLAALALLETKWMDKFALLSAITARLPAAAVAVPGAESGLSPNGVAGVLLWTAPPALALAAGVWLHFSALARARGRAQAWLAAIGLTVLAVGTSVVLVLTQSRSALAGLAAGLVAMPLLTVVFGLWRPARVPARYLWAAVGVALVVALAAGGWLWARGQARPLAAAAAFDSAAALDDGGLAARILIWPRALAGIEDFPITGMGLYTFQRVANVLYPPFGLSPDIVLSHAHNTWLQVALDLGLPGLVAEAAVWLAAAVMLAQTVRRARGPGPRALAVGLLGALAGSFVYGLTDTIPLGARPGFLWWMLLALATLVYLREGQIPQVGNQQSDTGATRVH